MGPKSTPMKETAMASAIRDGVNHIIISRLLGVKERPAHNMLEPILSLKRTRLPEVRT